MSPSVDTQYRRAKLKKLREDRYVPWQERIMAAESLEDQKPEMFENEGPAGIRLEDGEVSAAQLTIPTSFAVLQQTDIWICDTGASSHSTNNSSGGQNVKDRGSASLGHAGEI